MNTSSAAAAAGPSRRTLSHARRATRLQFAALGVIGGTWGAHIPSVKTRYDLSEAELSMVLLFAALGAIASLLLAGRTVGRLGARNAAAVAMAVMCAMFNLMLHLPGLWAVLPVAMVLGAGMSLFDVSINAEGSELEVLSGRAVMSNLHGMFSVGGMTGAALSSAMLAAGVAPALQLAAVPLAMLALAAIASRSMLETHGGPDDEKATFVWPRGLLLVIGLLIFAGMTAEGVMYDWSVLYLKQEVGMPQSRAALGYAIFSAAMAASRFCGDWLRSRYPEERLLRTGATVAAVGMATVLLLRDPVVSLVGYALVGAGLAPVAPILFNAATRVPGASRAAAIASVTSIGYAGFMVGPPLIGGIAQATTLGWAMSVLVFAAALLAWGARFVPKK